MLMKRNWITAQRVLGSKLQLILALLLGMSAFSASAELGLRVRDMPAGSGVEVMQVTPGSLAAQSGLKAGDLILQVEKGAITNADQFAQRVRGFPTGAPFSIRISREGWERDLLLPPAAAAVSQPKKFGLRLIDRAPDELPGHGAQIAAVTASSSAARAGLKPGDVVTQVDGRKLARASNLVLLMQEAAAQGKPLRLTVAREGWEKEVSLAPADMSAQQSAAEWNGADQVAESGALLPPQVQTAATSAPAIRQPAYPQTRATPTLDDASYQAYSADLDLAEANYQSANWPAAERHYRQAIQRVPGDPRSWGRLGYVLIMQQRFDEAVNACRKSLELGAPQPDTLNNLGFSYYKLGALAEAQAAYLKAIELAPQWAQPYSGLGAVYFTQQNWPQAERNYRLALERDPTNTADRQALDSVLRQQSRPTLTVQTAPIAAQRVPSAAARTRTQAEVSPAGTKAIIAIGDFQVKAAGAGQLIGDGLREMMVTTLHGSGNYIVVERMDLQGLAAEQALSRSRMARPGAAIPESQMAVAEIMVYAAVTEFEGEASGGGAQLGIPRLPFNFGHQSKTAHMAIDIRVVDVATGRLIAAQRISGEAGSSQTSIGTTLSASGTTMPISLGTFTNTPMEQAIRECVQKATAYITSNTPSQYFRHQ